MKLLLVMNPGSRSGRGRRLWPAWERGLRAAGVAFDQVATARPGHAFELARAAKGVDAVVAVGGDGTINEVLDGVVAGGDPGLGLAVLYSGTSPDFCRFHGIPLDPAAAVASLVDSPARAVDVVRATFRSADGSARTAHFGCSLNVGLGASVARLANRWRRYAGDAAGTGAAVVASILAARPPDLEVTVDGERTVLRRVNNLSIVKNPHLASGLRLDLDLGPADGSLYVVAVCGRSPAGMLGLVPGFYTGRVVDAPGVFVRRCREVTVASADRCEVEFDGDPRGFLPVRAGILPRGLRLLGGSR